MNAYYALCCPYLYVISHPANASFSNDLSHSSLFLFARTCINVLYVLWILVVKIQQLSSFEESDRAERKFFLVVYCAHCLVRWGPHISTACIALVYILFFISSVFYAGAEFGRFSLITTTNHPNSKFLSACVLFCTLNKLSTSLNSENSFAEKSSNSSSIPPFEGLRQRQISRNFDSWLTNCLRRCFCLIRVSEYILARKFNFCETFK